MTALPSTDPLEAKERNARGQGPRTQAHVFSEKKEGLSKNFSGDLQTKKKTIKVFVNFLRGFWRFSTKFQGFKNQCCLRAEDRAIFEDLRLCRQGQGQGPDL